MSMSANDKSGLSVFGRWIGAAVRRRVQLNVVPSIAATAASPLALDCFARALLLRRHRCHRLATASVKGSYSGQRSFRRLPWLSLRWCYWTNTCLCATVMLYFVAYRYSPWPGTLCCGKQLRDGGVGGSAGAPHGAQHRRIGVGKWLNNLGHRNVHSRGSSH